MAEYLKRDDVLSNADIFTVQTKEYGTIDVVSIEYIADLPTADVEEVRHGEWIVENSEKDWRDKDTYRLSIKCSQCGKTHFLGTTKYQNEYDKEKLKTLGNYADYSFCGKCGTRMDGKKVTG